MQVEREHRIDASEPDSDGMYEYYYEYDLYRFSAGELTVFARVYSNEPHRASFLRMELRGRLQSLSEDDLRSPLFCRAREYLGGRGVTEFSWLAPDVGYVAWG